ncbi:uncharacterized protein N7484_008206 [Penicillium longicatenatum]|uniref:uncharacterized protein n=1 Tax=Penicillium longicatenatum TaxID=1561947 RepID=UPI0025470598|nr:uncharacterized protein N7484_008206 [Penicillium longicatenatum]KAJ5640344.1 hypothetical protein N7484_008206 [Penicillium longicatenatum]
MVSQVPRLRNSITGNETTYYVKMLANTSVPTVKFNILRRLLPFDLHREGPDFFFGGQPVHQPHYTILSHRTQKGRIKKDGPFVGYLDYLNVTGIRGRLAKKLSRVTPQEWTEDPYFVCVLLSIAQFKKRLLKDSSTPSFSARLVVVNRDDLKFVHIYEAQFTCKFLEMLDKRTIATSCTDGPTIYRKEIPFQPFDTFPGRIQAETHASTSFSVNSAVSNRAKQSVKRAPQHEYSEGRNVRRKP